MDSSNKPAKDMEKAIKLREIAALNLNTFFIEKHMPFRIKRLHDCVEILSPSDRLQYNTMHKRVSEIDNNKAMGLDYILYNMVNPTLRIMIIFRFTDDSTCFIKIPSIQGDKDYSQHVYIDYLINEFNAHFIYLRKKDEGVSNLYSNLIPLSNLGYGYRSRSKGNTNRVDFSKIVPANIYCKNLNAVDLFGNHSILSYLNTILI